MIYAWCKRSRGPLGIFACDFGNVWALRRECFTATKAPHCVNVCVARTRVHMSVWRSVQVVKLGNEGKFTVDEQRLQASAAVLTNSESTDTALLRELRTLDSLVIHSQHLCSCPQIGKAVRSLRCHTDKSISKLATGLTTKWRTVVLSELPDKMR